MRFLTLVLLSKVTLKVILPETRLRIQASLLVLMQSPFPTFQKRPYWRISRLQSKERQIKNGLLPSEASIISVDLKYLAFRKRAIRESGFSRILQTCFAMSALLKRVRSQVSESQTTFIFRVFELIPRLPMHLFSFIVKTPPKICTRRFYFIVNGGRDL